MARPVRICPPPSALEPLAAAAGRAIRGNVTFLA
jgi:hypothetical protein